MKPLQAILNFLFSVASLFFRWKKDKPRKPVADDTGSPEYLPSGTGDSPGRHRGNTDPGETTGSPTTPVNMLGWALIATGTGGYLIKLLA